MSLLLLTACLEREMLNKALIGEWELESIACEKTDSIAELAELRFFSNKYLQNFTLHIKENSQYVYALNTLSTGFDTTTYDTGLVKFRAEEHGLIRSESGPQIHWEPQFSIQNKEKSSRFIAESSTAGDYKISCELGPLPKQKTNLSSFLLQNDELRLIGDVRLSYYKNQTGRARDDQQLRTILLFKRK